MVYALLLLGTAKRACYFSDLCDLSQEIQCIKTTEDAYVWGLELHSK